LQESLSGLLEGLRQALDVDFVLLRLRKSPDDRLSGLQVHVGEPVWMPDEEISQTFGRVINGESARSEPGDKPLWLALPMRLPEGQIPGMLLVGSSTLQGLHSRQEAILQTVAAQAALLVENERMLLSLEYKAVIQERNRLAREIHDGLAQTLAFLKLQAAQMQSYLDKGDLARLSLVLKDNYQTLAEAYLDTRQAIDNLRITPREGLESWLERTIAEFESAHGISTERRLQAVSPGWNSVLSPEVQAQMIRIVQEALNNVRKHARARMVTVSLFEKQDDLVLEIYDDGRGFDPEDVPEISQHGLRGIRERAELIGADFQIISQSRQGTAVRLVLPAFLKEGSR
jgi:two-component system, NarL family, nitrate/nitrite sensor histidine kinase NarX